MDTIFEPDDGGTKQVLASLELRLKTLHKACSSIPAPFTNSGFPTTFRACGMLGTT